MKASFLPLALFATSLSLTGLAQDQDPADEAKKKEQIRALILADAQKQAAQPAATAARPADKNAPGAPAALPAPKPADPSTPPPATPAPATMLPQVQVNKSRITDLDIAISEQDKAIAREQVNTKPTKLDETLNNPTVSKALAIFGGSSSDERSSLAQERVSIMEEEKELLEAMKLAKTKEDREELQRELDDLRATRRELEQGPK
jgi:hypothetical protein